METKIRPATERDLPSIDELLLEWLDFRRQRETSLREGLKKDELIVAEQNGEVVGFLHHVLHNDIIDGGTNSFIAALYVTPSQRRKGIGSMLLGRAIQSALKNGAVGIESSTTNPEARRLYEKHGFKQFRGEVFLEMDMNYSTSPCRT